MMDVMFGRLALVQASSIQKEIKKIPNEIVQS